MPQVSPWMRNQCNHTTKIHEPYTSSWIFMTSCQLKMQFSIIEPSVRRGLFCQKIWSAKTHISNYRCFTSGLLKKQLKEDPVCECLIQHSIHRTRVHIIPTTIFLYMKWLVLLVKICTLPETNSLRSKIVGWKTTFLLGTLPCRCYISFRECK